MQASIAAKTACPKCRGKMERGFVLDYTYGARVASTWIEGAPEQGWTGVRVRGKKSLQIEADRCTSCGFLEFYAK